ncbi:TonB-dependent siderophore receptor [Sphingomonas sp. HITSZ_GF]|uniref:TonB-dependent siderophore receptor n=1 Tax=Sphingomonas sp. HITSZ_GF TaxID=3037247 RepID=UPI00240E817D|nr:TonB-dependent siderophore receptor [Sphingomonas sp. HITSZ_GF]MDG2534159.1 TonB-dependent siderophore receptor [Sphingomonas sp. HITSZ_GF]
MTHQTSGKLFGQARLALLSACAVIGWSGAAMAQESTDPAPAQDETIVVTGSALSGTKTDTPLTQLPQSVSVITAEEFQDRAAVNFQDVFRYSAGVTPELNGVDTRGDFLSARGFDISQYLDGLNRMPSFIYGGRMEIYTVERAEVLRGPSSTLYGGGGPGGILNAITKRPQEEFAGEVGVTVGTDARKEFRFDVTGGLTDGISARLVGLARDGHLQQPSQADDRLLIMPAVTFKPGPNTEITLIGLYQKDRLGSQTYLPTSKTIDAPNSTVAIPFDFYLGEPDFNHTRTDTYSGTALFTQRFGDNVSFNSRNRYFDTKVDYQEVYADYFYTDAARTSPYRYWYFNRAQYNGFSTDNNLVLSFSTGPFEHQVLFGADYTWFKEDKSEGFGLAPSINVYAPVYGQPFTTAPWGPNKVTKNSQLGFYAQDQIRAWDTVSLVFGLRHDSVKSNVDGVQQPDNNAWTFRAGIIGDVAKGVSPYFNYSESFLAVFGTSFAGVAFVPRAGRQYEAGVKFAPVKGALLTASVFDIQESNYLIQDPTNIQNFLQNSKVGSKGIELEGSFHLPGGLDLTAAYSYTRVKFLENPVASIVGNRVGNLPEHQASAWASKKFTIGNALQGKAGIGVRYQGDKVDTNQIYYVDPTTLVDAMFEFDYKGWNLSVNASNIFDTKVYTNCGYSLAAQEGYCYLGKDRTILASARFRF